MIDILARVFLALYFGLNVFASWRNWKVRFLKNQAYLNFVNLLSQRNKGRMTKKQLHQSIARISVFNGLINLTTALLLQQTLVTILCLGMTCLEIIEYFFSDHDYPAQYIEFNWKEKIIFYVDRLISCYGLLYYPFMILGLILIH